MAASAYIGSEVRAGCDTSLGRCDAHPPASAQADSAIAQAILFPRVARGLSLRIEDVIQVLSHRILIEVAYAAAGHIGPAHVRGVSKRIAHRRVLTLGHVTRLILGAAKHA